MSKKDIAEVIRMSAEVLENFKLEINDLRTETKESFGSIKNHIMNLVKDHEECKE